MLTLAGKTRDRHFIGALPEAYSRVTNPERFRPLHELALALVSRLRGSYELAEREAFDLVPGLMQPFEHARPPVTLTPAASDAAPIAIAFTPFPSLIVRCGRWFGTSLPICGCDACAATAAQEGARLEELLGDVVAGNFGEELTIPWIGDLRVKWWLGSAAVGDGHHGEGMTTLPRKLARVLGASRSTRVQWRPWGQRKEGTPGRRAV
jgi:Family of unknown function (DUF6226)